MAKILNFYKIDSINDFTKYSNQKGCNTVFLQKTNVFSYYIVKPLLLYNINNFSDFLKKYTDNFSVVSKDCVIFYDYLKLMDSAGISQDMKEYQVLGFMMTSLHNFATKYKVPIVAFIQLNRDGITKESTDTASGSDRIIWLCSNFSIFKRKSDEEIAEDGPNAGNRKLIPLVSRHGGGLEDNDYINCNMKGWCAKITEGQTKLELSNNTSQSKNSFQITNVDNESNEEEISFT